MFTQLNQFIRLSRFFDAVFPLISLFLGAVLSGAIDDDRFVGLIFLVIMLNSAAMVWNDIEDREIDADNGRPELKDANPATRRRLKLFVVVLVAASILIAATTGIATFLLSLVTVGVIWAYNSKPFLASRRPVASILVLSGAGAFLPYLLGLSLHNPSVQFLLAGVCLWIGRVSLSILKDYKDAIGDAKHHKKTFLLRFGRRRVAYVSVLCLVLGYAVFVAILLSQHEKIWMLLVILLAIIGLVYGRRELFDNRATYGQLDKTFRKIAQYQLLLDAGLVWWLI